MKLASRPVLVSIVVITVASPTFLAAQEVEAGFTKMPFDEAAEGLFIRSVPLTVAIPSDYTLAKNEPKWGTWLWTTQDSLDHMQEKGFASPDEGAIQIRVAMSIAYDRSSRTFRCGPECSQADYVAQIKKGGATEVVTENHEINGIPVFFLEATIPSPEPYPPTRIYMAHIALFIDTNAALFSYTPPSDDPDRGQAVWAQIKQTMLESK